jgi:hypothetical protein
VAGHRGPTFGISLALTRGGTVQKVYFGGDSLTPGERRCIGQKAKGQHFGAEGTIVELDAHVDVLGPHLRRR